MTKFQQFMSGFKRGEQYAAEHSSLFFPFVFITASVITIIVTVAVIPPLANLLLVTSGCVSVLWGPQLFFGIKELIYPSIDESEAIHINPFAESEEIHTMQSLDAQFDAVESFASMDEQKMVDENYRDFRTGEIMEEPVKLNTGNFYVDEQTALLLLDKKKPECPFTRKPLEGYKKQPELKKEIADFIHKVVARKDEQKKRNNESKNETLEQSSDQNQCTTYTGPTTQLFAAIPQTQQTEGREPNSPAISRFN